MIAEALVLFEIKMPCKQRHWQRISYRMALTLDSPIIASLCLEVLKHRVLTQVLYASDHDEWHYGLDITVAVEQDVFSECDAAKECKSCVLWFPWDWRAKIFV